MARDRFPRVFRGPVGQPVHVQLAFQYAIVRAWAKRGYEARFGCFLALTRPLQALTYNQFVDWCAPWPGQADA